MGFDVETLARFQFAFTIMFHMTFPAITVGLSIFLCITFGRYLKTGDPVFLQMFRFWRRIFAVGFALGVATGIVITFQMGLNWSGFAGKVGPIIGPIIGMEVVSAFFVEAAFIGLVLYGDGRIKKTTMFFATIMVAVGTVLSTTWIIMANTWMQHPVGYEVLANGQFSPTDWFKIIANPAFTWRYLHMLFGVLIGASMVVVGLSAYYLLKRRELNFAKRSLSMSLGVLSIFLPMQVALGNTAANRYVAPMQSVESVPLDVAALEQGVLKPSENGEGPTVPIPVKIIAMEGNPRHDTSQGWIIAQWYDNGNGDNYFEINPPCLGSWMNSRDLGCNSAGTPGMDIIPDDAKPNVNATFWGFRIMFYASLVMFASIIIGAVLSLRKRLFVSPKYHKFLLWTTPMGIIAIEAGWVLAESGRQPWVVWNELKTADAYSGISLGQMWTSLILFITIYATLFAIYVGYIIRAMRIGPERDRELGVVPNGDQSIVPASPNFLGGSNAELDDELGTARNTDDDRHAAQPAGVGAQTTTTEVAE